MQSSNVTNKGTTIKKIVQNALTINHITKEDMNNFYNFKNKLVQNKQKQQIR